MDNAACLTARELRYSLGARRLINDVSLSLAGGEMVAIIGPNGAGKSTLLRLLTGYLTPDCGECRLLDRPLEQWAPQQLAKVRAVMRQYSDLAFPFSVEEVVSMGRAPHGKRDEHQAINR